LRAGVAALRCFVPQSAILSTVQISPPLYLMSLLPIVFSGGFVVQSKFFFIWL